ncbi:hypothetical protein CERSUDRAFT_117868 [Gelatoporia subvermispora B]|uniref:Uncharacterized protein n=1 Tax=Ceriporiopsis subvermispora (strain B) TaxID=914234 RepID=M2R6I1_CERS8|nr:hypothetical protein CERSUDRAFT_117868 [Gelatoporia subvermispora B]
MQSPILRHSRIVALIHSTTFAQQAHTLCRPPMIGVGTTSVPTISQESMPPPKNTSNGSPQQHMRSATFAIPLVAELH